MTDLEARSQSNQEYYKAHREELLTRAHEALGNKVPKRKYGDGKYHAREIANARQRAYNKKWNLHRRDGMLVDRGDKIIRVEYPDCDTPDYYSAAEYNRRKSEFDADAVIFKNGERQDRLCCSTKP